MKILHAVKVDLLESLATLAVFMASVWLLVFPALAWGKTAIPAADITRLLGRTARLSVVVGLPCVAALFVGFGLLALERPPLGELLPRSAAIAVGFLPLYAVLIATSLFQSRHRADRAAGRARPLVVRLLSGLAILLGNGLACLVMLFTLFASTGVYRGWN